MMDKHLLQRASRMFNSVADLRTEEDRRINEWFKSQIEGASAVSPPLPEAVREQREALYRWVWERVPNHNSIEFASRLDRLLSKAMEAAAQQERARTTLICHCGYAMLPMNTVEHVYGCTKCGNSVRLVSSHPPPTPLANDGVWPCGCVWNDGEQIEACAAHPPPTPEDQ
jgi:hypothetical protein